MNFETETLGFCYYKVKEEYEDVSHILPLVFEVIKNNDLLIESFHRTAEIINHKAHMTDEVCYDDTNDWLNFILKCIDYYQQFYLFRFLQYYESEILGRYQDDKRMYKIIKNYIENEV